ncbi:MAG: hypothetical protein JWR05_2278 [Mucilaginibacter sp.]|nr:hypothetical protein [Mucilaginibacter sp.]
MAKVNIYPSKYELIEVLTSITNRGFLNAFAQERGIFITHVDIATLANEVSNIFLDNDDLELIRKEAYQNNSSHALSGFVLKSDDKKFNLKLDYQWIFDNGKQKQGQIINQLTKVSKDSEIYKGSIEYNKKRAGRMEFLQDEVSHFDFYIEETEPGSWQVEIDGNRSTDSKELKELLSEVLRKNTEILSIEQALLNTESSIIYFDRLATNGMTNEWNFKTVIHLTLKMGNDEEPKQDDLDEIHSANEEELVGITQAILQGQNLRENAFVKQSVKSGYRFNAMTYEFHHVREPYIIQIKAEFKGRPKVFEVSIVDYEEVVGTLLNRQKITVPESHSREIRSQFWNNSKGIFNEIINRR